MNWLDPIGASLSLLCTYYFTSARRSAWVLELLAITINAFLYWQTALYGAVIKDGIYFVSILYGWYQWSMVGVEGSLRPIRYLTLKELLNLSAMAAIGIFILFQCLSRFTQSDVPLWDAANTVLSLLAQYLLCIKAIECWILWFIVDISIALLQFYKEIPFHSAVHWLYLGLAVVGFIRWRRIYRQENPMWTPLKLVLNK
jgi:nicotinamide mononucleotide transporter